MFNRNVGVNQSIVNWLFIKRLEIKDFNCFKISFLVVCPRGSFAVGRECFSLHLEERHNWTSSRAFCRNMGGDLAEPNLFNNKLPKQLAKTWPTLKKSKIWIWIIVCFYECIPSSGSYWTFWVGATDQEREGEWHWVTGGLLDLRQSSRWSLGEPPDLGKGQDCLAMILWVPGKFSRWDLLDDPCDLEWYVFCEYSKVMMWPSRRTRTGGVYWEENKSQISFVNKPEELKAYSS